MCHQVILYIKILKLNQPFNFATALTNPSFVEYSLSPSADDRALLYSNLASGAESGWDFSSRWLAHSGPHTDRLSSITTSSIVAVDLSAILCSNEAALARLFTATGENFPTHSPLNNTYTDRELL